MTLDANQKCRSCGRNFKGEDESDVQPGCACPSEDCPSNCLGKGDGSVGLICEDVVDGGFVRLETPRES